VVAHQCACLANPKAREDSVAISARRPRFVVATQHPLTVENKTDAACRALAKRNTSELLGLISARPTSDQRLQGLEALAD
jgi:hypothetical protein